MNDPHPQLPLHHPTAWVPLVWPYKIAVCCALGPLAVGIGCVAGYALTYSEVFIVVGFLTLFGGALAWVVALAMACVYLFQGNAGLLDPYRKQRAGRLLLLLMLSPVAAWLCAAAGWSLASQHSKNAGGQREAIPHPATFRSPAATHPH